MATLKTEITEIVTGLALLGYRQLDHTLGVRPRLVEHVTEAHFDRLDEAFAAGRYRAEFELAWDNGRRFATAAEGLRGRPPWRVEWKGNHKPPGYEQIPADLRVDHVYLISAKYGSNILTNASPAHLFERLLAERRSEERADWFGHVAPEAYQELYATCRRELGDLALPLKVDALTAAHRHELKNRLRGAWPGDAKVAYQWMATLVATESAQRWRARLHEAPGRDEEMLWRLLRLQAAPYFVLGQSADGKPLHYLVGTPWDFRARFRLRTIDAWADPVGQATVRWRAEVRDRETGEDRHVDGHVEVRWSHGRFSGMPEAKVYLDSPHHDVPGYEVLR